MSDKPTDQARRVVFPLFFSNSEMSLTELREKHPDILDQIIERTLEAIPEEDLF